MSQDNNDKLAKPVKLGQTNTQNSPTGWGLRGKLQQAQKTNTTLNSTANNIENAREKIVIVADDSGSMDGLPMLQQKKAIEEFLKVCNPNDTAVGVTPLNREVLPLTMYYPALTLKVKEWPNEFGGGTPTYETLEKVLSQSSLPSRVVLISDGQPTDGRAKRGWNDWDEEKKETINSTLKKYIEKKIPVDTVFIGSSEDTNSVNEMKAIAELTGGLYIFFKEGESFAQKFKYLSPVYYKALTMGEIKL